MAKKKLTLIFPLDISYNLLYIHCSVRIDGESGIVYLVSQPRGDSNIRYEVELVATDGGGKSTTATLVINFKKEFPNAPKFDSHIYNATVYENRTRFNNEPVRVRVCEFMTKALVTTVSCDISVDFLFSVGNQNFPPKFDY